jgi:hypothetical protein
VSFCGKDPDKRNGKASLGYAIDVSAAHWLGEFEELSKPVPAPLLCNGSAVAVNGECPI